MLFSRFKKLFSTIFKHAHQSQGTAKKLHFKIELEQSKNNPCRAWEIIQSVLPCKTNSHPPISLQVQGAATDDPTIIVNELNKLFCSTGVKLANNIKSDKTKSPITCLTKNVSKSIYLNNSPTHNEILNLIMSLNDNKAVEHDNIPAFFLKTSRHVIRTYFKFSLNFIFQNGIFPSNCKTAKVVPIYKSGRNEEAINYRLISILTCFLRIIEKLKLLSQRSKTICFY